jgi:hypothetical protein
MLPPNEIIARTLSVCRGPDGSVRQHEALTFADAEITAAVTLGGDPQGVEAVEHLAQAELWRRITGASRRARRSAERSAPAQGTMYHRWGLHEGHVVDSDGTRLKETDELTQLEFARIREIRREQIEHDRAYLELLDNVADALDPIWQIAPELTLGRATALYLAARVAAE